MIENFIDNEKIFIDESEKEQIKKMCLDDFSIIEKLKNVNVVFEKQNKIMHLRQDIAKKSFDKKMVLKNSSNVQDDYIKV